MPERPILDKSLKSETFQEYYYLNYRDGKKVVSKFLGNVVDYNIEELKENLNKRKDLSKVIKKLKLEQKEILKELR